MATVSTLRLSTIPGLHTAPTIDDLRESSNVYVITLRSHELKLTTPEGITNFPTLGANLRYRSSIFELSWQ